MYYDKRTEVMPEPQVQPQLDHWQRVYLDAAQYIREHGWVRGTAENGLGNVCLFGAIARAEGYESRTAVHLRVIYMVFTRHAYVRHLRKILDQDPIGWNDDLPNWGGGADRVVINLLERAARGE